MSVAVPADWATPNAYNDDSPILVFAVIQKPAATSDASILCSASVLPSDIVTLRAL